MLDVLEKSILRTVAYFSAWNYPVTAWEIWRYLDRPVKLSMVLDQLDNSDGLRSILRRKDGFYFLADDEELVTARLRRYAISQKKMKRALAVSRVLSFFPWVRAIAVYSSLSFAFAGNNSDIDLFVVTASKRIWSARFFINSFLKIFCLRPTKNKHRDKICVSFLATEENLSLRQTIKGDDDWHYPISHSQFMFIYDEKAIAQKFATANSWLQNKFPNIFFCQPIMGWLIKPRLALGKKIMEKIFSLIPESWFRRWQWRLLPAEILDLAAKSNQVILNNGLIKLHDRDRREVITQKTLAYYEQLKI